MTEADLLLPAIAAGDPTAFARWLGSAEPRLRASLGRFAAVADVEAVVQETALRIWQVAPRVHADGRGDTLTRLAIRIGRNLCIDEARRQRLEPTELRILERLLDDDPAPAELPDPLLRALIQACREKLPAQPALALRLRLEDAGARPDAELAEQAGMRTNTFLQNVGRARKLLAICLEDHGVSLEVAP